MPGCNSEDENLLISKAKQYLSTYDDMAEMIRLGAYRQGADPMVDEAIHFFPMLEEFMNQGKKERATLPECYAVLANILANQPTTEPA
jgi:flagellum-specific ATP synthase